MSSPNQPAFLPSPAGRPEDWSKKTRDRRDCYEELVIIDRLLCRRLKASRLCEMKEGGQLYSGAVRGMKCGCGCGTGIRCVGGVGKGLRGGRRFCRLCGPDAQPAWTNI